MKTMWGIVSKTKTSQRCFDSLASIRQTNPDAVCFYDDINIYKAKNQMIDLAQKNGAKYLFIIEDCVVVTDCSVFDKYIELLDKWDVLFASYSFCGPFNRVMNSKPNPGVKLTTDWGEFHFGKHLCDKMLVFNVEKLGSERFDDKLESLSREEFSNRMKLKGLQPFNGFFFDVIDSWKYFKDDETASTFFNPKTFQEDAIKDSQYLKDLNIELKIDFSVDALVQWVKEKIARS